MNILDEIEQEQIGKLTADKAVPDFGPGDTLRVNVRVKEGGRSRIQAFEGVCIARSNNGVNSNFTVRKISYNEGVERVFPLYSPVIESIEVMRRGKVRRAKLYYLRGRRGKAARIAEKADWAKGAVADEEKIAAAREEEVEATVEEAVEAAKAEEAEAKAEAEAESEAGDTAAEAKADRDEKDAKPAKKGKAKSGGKSDKKTKQKAKSKAEADDKAEGDGDTGEQAEDAKKKD